MMRNAGGALPNRHILGNYELFEEIGRGGMGIVYRALDLSLDRVVAIKILRDDLRAHQSIVTRFSREAQAAARLDHPNIVQIFSVGAADRTPYIAMEFVDALPLSAVMQREHRIEWKPALEIARQIAAALACAHDSHVIHRDVKPPNILLDDHHRAFVTDFGIAKILTLDDNLTVDGTRLGTPHYMAPERCKNGEVTAASDLYSLGVLMFQMLTGRLPYEASTPVEMVQRIIAEPPARVRRYVADVPEDVERLVAWLMEMNPRHRPENGHVVCDAIDRVLAGLPLDVNERRATVAIEDFRKNLAADMSASRQTASDGDASKRGVRRAIAIVSCIVAALLVGAFAWRAQQPSAPIGSAGNPAAWFTTERVATFDNEGKDVMLAQLDLPGYAMYSLLPIGADGTVAVSLERTDAGGKRVLCTVSPVAKSASIPFVTDPSARMELLASAGGLGSSLFGGYGLMRALDDVTFVSLRDERTPMTLTEIPGDATAVGMHPSGAQWAVATHEANGASAITAYALENGQVAARPFVSAGPRVTYIQYSGDGSAVAYLRETASGAYALRVVPSTGVAIEPTAICEGHIAVGPGAFNADGSAILVSIERDGGHPVLVAVSTADGSVLAEFDGALCGAWDALEGGVVFSAPDRKGIVQLWRARTDAPTQRTQMTYLDAGTDRAVLVSTDRQWATTFAANAPDPSVVFVRLAQ